MTGPVVVPLRLGVVVNAFLVRDEGAVLVDAGLAGREARLLRALARAGVAPRDVALVVVTHAHADHVGGAEALRRATGAPVLLGAADAGHARDPRTLTYRATGAAGRLAAPLVRGWSRLRPGRPFEADLLADAPMDLARFGVRGRVEPTPGHTPGSLSVVTAGGDAIVGDLAGAMPWRARLDVPIFADDEAELRRQARRVAAMPIERVHVGHGGPTFPREALARIGAP